jgi:hypothetical protein
MAGGRRLTRYKALDFQAGVVKAGAWRRLWHDEIALFGERLLLLLIEHKNPLRLTRAFPAFNDAGGRCRFQLRCWRKSFAERMASGNTMRVFA